jgi:hypothetical protein
MAERTLTDRIMGFVYDNGPQPVRDFIERRESRREAEEHYRKEAADNRPLQSTTLREHIADRVYEAMPERVQSRLDDRAIQKLVVQQDIDAAQSAAKEPNWKEEERYAAEMREKLRHEENRWSYNDRQEWLAGEPAYRAGDHDALPTPPWERQNADLKASAIDAIQEAHDRMLTAERTGTEADKLAAASAQGAMTDNPTADALLGNRFMAHLKEGLVVDFNGGIEHPVYAKASDLAAVLQEVKQRDLSVEKQAPKVAPVEAAVKSAAQPARERAWAAADAQASLDLSPRQTQSARAAVRLGG